MCRIATKKEAANKKLKCFSSSVSRLSYPQILRPQTTPCCLHENDLLLSLSFSMNFISWESPVPTNSLIIHYRNFPKEPGPINSSMEMSTDTSSPMILQIPHFKILSSLFPPIVVFALCVIFTHPQSSLLDLRDLLYIKFDLSINSGLLFLLPDTAKALRGDNLSMNFALSYQ